MKRTRFVAAFLMITSCAGITAAVAWQAGIAARRSALVEEWTLDTAPFPGVRANPDSVPQYMRGANEDYGNGLWNMVQVEYALPAELGDAKGNIAGEVTVIMSVLVQGNRGQLLCLMGNHTDANEHLAEAVYKETFFIPPAVKRLIGPYEILGIRYHVATGGKNVVEDTLGSATAEQWSTAQEVEGYRLSVQAQTPWAAVSCGKFGKMGEAMEPCIPVTDEDPGVSE